MLLILCKMACESSLTIYGLHNTIGLLPKVDYQIGTFLVYLFCAQNKKNPL